MFALPIGGDDRLERLETRHADALFAVVDRHRDTLGAYDQWPWDLPTLDACRRWVGQHRDLDARDEALTCGIWRGAELVGLVALGNIDAESLSAVLWGFVAPPVEGSGVATRAVRALFDVGFEGYALERVTYWCAVDNARSRRLAVHLGCAREGELRSFRVIRGRFVDHLAYSALRPEWPAVKERAARVKVRAARAGDEALMKSLGPAGRGERTWVADGAGAIRLRVKGACATISGLEVLPVARRRGVGRRLVEVAGGEVAIEGVRVLRADVPAGARRFAERCGFVDVGGGAWVLAAG